MPIPPFDSHGNLAVGPSLVDPTAARAHNTPIIASMSEIHDRFVEGHSPAGSPSRTEIWDGWQRHRSETARLGVKFVTLVNGSFITEKPDPGDVDIVLVYDGPAFDAMTTRDRLEFKRLTAGPSVKATHHCDAYGVPTYDIAHGAYPAVLRLLGYWMRLFGHDKQTRGEKGFLLVTEGVTP